MDGFPLKLYWYKNIYINKFVLQADFPRIMVFYPIFVK